MRIPIVVRSNAFLCYLTLTFDFKEGKVALGAWHLSRFESSLKLRLFSPGSKLDA
jgi:hypothetical protein